jgi:hypothetical protein
MRAIILRFSISTVVATALFMWLYMVLGYERVELLAFAILIGLSVAVLKAH